MKRGISSLRWRRRRPSRMPNECLRLLTSAIRVRALEQFPEPRRTHAYHRREEW